MVRWEARHETGQLRSTLGRHSAAIKRLEEENSVLKQDTIAMKEHVLRIEGKNAVMNEQIQQILADPKHDESVQVAFSVVSHNGTFGPVEEDTNIPYDITYTNIGGGWNTEDNVFQALVPGVYQFTASMFASVITSSTYCHIVHTSPSDTIKVASMRAFGHSSYPSGYEGDANSVIIELALGDWVSVQLQSGDGYIWSNSAYVTSTFSGFLLFQ